MPGLSPVDTSGGGKDFFPLRSKLAYAQPERKPLADQSLPGVLRIGARDFPDYFL